MIEQPAYVKVLLQKYIEGTASPQEVARLMIAWDLYDDDELADMAAEVTGDFKNSETPSEETAGYRNETSRSVKKILLKGFRYVDIILLTSVIVPGCFFIWLFTKPNTKPFQFSCNGVAGNTELSTGKYNCKLILSNSSNMLIDSTYKGLITQEAGAELIQPEPGLLVYQRRAGMVEKEKSLPLYHTIVTPPGQQYKVILPDGSKLWLNAATSIRFPVTLIHNKRIVYLSGEAFFDVVPDSAAPFYIYSGNTEINVEEGTMNVNTYTGKTIATILTGRFEVKSGSQTVRLTAGKKAMAVVSEKQLSNQIILSAGDTLSAVSWKKTTRLYTNASMRDFVADIGRWYNLEIVNFSCIPASAHISVAMCYNTPIEQVLTIFGESGLKFYKVGKRITFCDPSLRALPGKSIPFK